MGSCHFSLQSSPQEPAHARGQPGCSCSLFRLPMGGLPMSLKCPRPEGLLRACASWAPH